MVRFSNYFVRFLNKNVKLDFFFWVDLLCIQSGLQMTSVNWRLYRSWSISKIYNLFEEIQFIIISWIILIEHSLSLPLQFFNLLDAAKNLLVYISCSSKLVCSVRRNAHHLSFNSTVRYIISSTWLLNLDILRWF